MIDSKCKEKKTPDRTKYPEKIEKRRGWRDGGNALTLLLDGSGSRMFFTTEDNRGRQPLLELSYEPASVDFNDTCLKRKTLVSVAGSQDDAVENLTTGVVDTESEELVTSEASELNLIAVKFNGLDIPQGASILDARLRLQSQGFTGGVIDATVFGDSTANSTYFNAGTPAGLSSRPSTGATVSWLGLEQLDEGSLLESPNLSAIVQEIVNKADWVPRNNITIMLNPTSSAGRYNFSALDGEDAQGAELAIDYQIDETTLAGNPVVLKTARDELLDEVLDISVGAWTPLVDMLYEAGLYFRSEPVHFGKTRGIGAAETRNSIQRVAHEDTYTGGNLYRPPSCSDVDLSNVACVEEKINGNPVYQPPEAASCLANNIVLLTDGAAKKNTAKGLVQLKTGNPTCANRANADEECGLELADWLYKTDHDLVTDGDQVIKVHTIGFNYSSSFLSELANLGGGGAYTVENSNSLSNAFQEIANSAADISTSYVAPTVSVSQLNTLSHSDEIYYAMFKPQVTSKWDGNLKRYRLGEYNGETAVLDAIGAPAIDKTTGSITNTAQSFWGGFQDGAEITEGGAASQLALPRNILTFQPSATGVDSLEAFHENNTYLNATTLDLDDDTYRTELIQWARGVDVKDTDNDGDVTEVRAQMGDPLHSAPHIINYAGTTDTKSVVFVATNEGYLHAIDSESGVEDYAIIPPDLLPNLDTFYKNEVVEDESRTYGLDGDVIGWIEDANGNRLVDGTESAYVVVGMRRGGSNYYAFNVSDPANPEVAWVIKNTDADFTELGQTWSRPVKTKLKVGGVDTDVLIFSGGYDTAADSRIERGDPDAADSKGRAIFVVNAKTGAFIKRFDSLDDANMVYSIPSSPRVIDINFDGLADYLFVGDTGGQIWRLDFINATTADDFEMHGGLIADLAWSGSYANRHFYYEPDVAVLTDENNVMYLNIAIGSGWRAQPLNKVVKNRMYVIRDYAIYGPPRDDSDAIKYSTLAESDLFNATNGDTGDDTTDLSLNGFYIEMKAAGEKIVSTALTINSNLLFTSYVPGDHTDDPCQAAVGSSQFYAIDARNAKSILNLDGTLTEDGAEEIGLSDRNVKLNAPGIAPSPSVLLRGGGADPLVLVGLEEPDGSKGLDIGNSFKRTFWAAPENLD